MIVRLVAAVLAVLGGAVQAILDLGAAATVARPADRGVAFTPGADCDLDTVEALARRHPAVGQFVLMATEHFGATTGTVEVAIRMTGGAWRCQRGAQVAEFGRTGTRPLSDRRSGDGTTPAGVFPLGDVTAWDGERFSMFGNRADPGVQVPYRAVQRADCWGATASTARYQHLVERVGCTGPDEWLVAFGEAYSHAAVIGANLDPISGDEPGEAPYAAAIFLHRTSFRSDGSAKPTSGCVSLGYEDLVDTLRALDPDLEPHFAIGPREWLRTAG